MGEFFMQPSCPKEERLPVPFANLRAKLAVFALFHLMNISLSSHHALVGGSTQGIGWATAETLAALGATVTLLARNEAMLSNLVPTLPRPEGQSHHYLVADFTDPESVRSVVANHLAAGNPEFKILINNTGGPPGGPIKDASLNEFYAAYHMHLACNHLLAQTLLPGMEKAGYGRIVNVISTSVKMPLPGLGVSNTTRGAVASWAKTLSLEVAHLGITVNNVLPGFTQTARLDQIIDNKVAKSGRSREAVIAEYLDTVPARRFADPQETANVIAFLCTPAAAYVNGVNLPVDGGRTGSL